MLKILLEDASFRDLQITFLPYIFKWHAEMGDWNLLSPSLAENVVVSHKSWPNLNAHDAIMAMVSRCWSNTRETLVQTHPQPQNSLLTLGHMLSLSPCGKNGRGECYLGCLELLEERIKG